MTPVWVIGGGPAGLMAAQRVAEAGIPVVIADQKPSLARKFLMAGKSGLNLTMDKADAEFLTAYTEGRDGLSPILQAFGPDEVKAFAQDLDQEIFTGSTGRVFPKAMKASPLLRAWLRYLDGLGVTTRTGWRWTGWQDEKLTFETGDGPQAVETAATILAMGGGSWARLGSDGKWADILGETVPIAPFGPSNATANIAWSGHMEPHFGTPVKSIELRCGEYSSRGEVILSATGLEGGGVYSVTPGLRMGAGLILDLLPDLSLPDVEKRLADSKSSDSIANRLRKALRLPKVKQALLQECARPLPKDPAALAGIVKALPILDAKPGPLDGAISTSGGIRQAAVTDGLMLKSRPGTFAAGEMLDWDAPTGGYLITACLATGSWAGCAAVQWLQTSRSG